MICPNCSSETNRYTTVMDDDGKPFIFCPYCPRPKTENQFPAVLGTKKRGRPKKIEKGYEGVFDRVNPNSPEEIARNRSFIRSVPALRDSRESRLRDSVDKECHTIGVISDYSPEGRMNLIEKKFDKKFGRNNWKIKKDDGMSVTAVKVN